MRVCPAEMTALVEYVRAGGGLFYLGDHGNSDRNGDGVNSVLVMNRFATAKGNPFGITLAGDNFFSSSIHNVVSDRPETSARAASAANP